MVKITQLLFVAYCYHAIVIEEREIFWGCRTGGIVLKKPQGINAFKVCKSVHHHTIQIDHQPDATILRFIILTFIYSSTCFGCSPAHHQELNDCSSSLWFYLRIVVIALLCSWSGRPARPRTQHGYHQQSLSSCRLAGERPKHVEL